MNTTTTPTAVTPRAQAEHITSKANPHRKEDGSYWAMGAAGSFESFGAIACYAVPSGALGMNGRGPTFMIKLQDGLWHYAHDNRGSYYAAAEGYDAPNGAIAWIYNVQHVRACQVESARIALSEAEAEFRDAQNALALLIAKPLSNPVLHTDNLK